MEATKEDWDNSLSIPIAAMVLEKSQDTIRRWVKAKKIESFKYGGQYRIPLSEIEKKTGKKLELKK